MEALIQTDAVDRETTDLRHNEGDFALLSVCFFSTEAEGEAMRTRSLLTITLALLTAGL